MLFLKIHNYNIVPTYCKWYIPLYSHIFEYDQFNQNIPQCFAHSSAHCTLYPPPPLEFDALIIMCLSLETSLAILTWPFKKLNYKDFSTAGNSQQPSSSALESVTSFCENFFSKWLHKKILNPTKMHCQMSKKQDY